MRENMIEDSRIKILNNGYSTTGKYVLYWMQASQRTEYNHALEYAVKESNRLNIPLVVYFGITNYPEANRRHYRFMLEGLVEIVTSLSDLGATPVVRIEPPPQGVVRLSHDAALTVFDRGYTFIQRQWRQSILPQINCKVVEVETDVIVPVETASHKEEYAAATLRPKINRVRDKYLIPLIRNELKHTVKLDIDSDKLDNIDTVLDRLNLDNTVSTVEKYYRGGYNEASRLLNDFIANKLDYFSDKRNDPSTDFTSGLSPYLHFGQISPLEISLRALEAESPAIEDFLEELIVRRELSANFVYFNPEYATYSCLPAWSRKTLGEHSKDPREYLYTVEELENAATHDPYWNAAQREMLITGKMHGYMRMYWGKKIIEWTPSPEQSFEIALHLNNKYELDGRDPNGFTGVAWCFGKHDRPWKERDIFGMVRYMNANGLKRKFDIQSYLQKISLLK